MSHNCTGYAGVPPRSVAQRSTGSACQASALTQLAAHHFALRAADRSREGNPTPIARITGIPEAQLHVWLGWALLVVALLPLAFATRGVVGFVRETVRYDRGDVGWLVRRPVGVFTGRFRRHEGHFDPASGWPTSPW